MIRPATPDDMDALMNLASAIDLFQPHELEQLGNILAGYFDGSLGSDHFWLTYDDGGPVGVAYFAPEPYAYGTWNLYFIAVHPDRQGEGRGATLLRHVEQTLAARAALRVTGGNFWSAKLRAYAGVLPQAGVRRGSANPRIL